jgi:hypothetical protein
MWALNPRPGKIEAGAIILATTTPKYLKGFLRGFILFYFILFNTASAATSLIALGRRMLELIPGVLHL